MTSRITSLTHSIIQIIVKLQDFEAEQEQITESSLSPGATLLYIDFKFQLFNFERIFLLFMWNLCLLKNVNEFGLTFLTKNVQLKSELDIHTIKMV